MAPVLKIVLQITSKERIIAYDFSKTGFYTSCHFLIDQTPMYKPDAVVFCGVCTYNIYDFFSSIMFNNILLIHGVFAKHN